MITALYQVIGRASLALERVRAKVSNPGSPHDAGRNDGGDTLDRTGLLVPAARSLPVLWDDEDVMYVEYDSFAHSFWRAQEFSLFRAHRALLKPPVLDFGTGDGSFASVLFTHIDYGVDNDPEALRVAEQYGLYGKLLPFWGRGVSLEDGAVNSVFSNSVLEHVTNLDLVLSEIHRILSTHGTFVFTVPLLAYRIHLTKYFGLKESERINSESCHRNLFESARWQLLLAKLGFELVSIRQYQPDWFTFWYRMFRLLGNRGLARFVPSIRVHAWTLCQRRLVEMVKRSLVETSDGANIFVVARKGPAPAGRR